jgi:hypothetical protein
MIRFVTCVVVLLLVACGGGNSGGTASPSLMSLWPVDQVNVGTKYTYAVTKVRSIGGSGQKNRDVTLETGRMPGPPSIDFVGEEGNALFGFAFQWTSRGLELGTSMGAGLDSLGTAPNAWLTDGLCITAMSPNLLLLPATLTPGSTHACTMFHNMVSAGSVTWNGAESGVAGHPDAQRLTSVVSGPYVGGFGSRTTATQWRVTTVWILAPNVGPVQVTFTEDFLAPGDVVVDRVVYTCTLTSVTPGP